MDFLFLLKQDFLFQLSLPERENLSIWKSDSKRQTKNMHQLKLFIAKKNYKCCMIVLILCNILKVNKTQQLMAGTWNELQSNIDIGLFAVEQ